jgi:predicted RNase H-like nuclease (RuvC/YqgF family)
MKPYYIYGLYSTRFSKKNFTHKIKYVGKTDNPKIRLRTHLHSATNGKESILYDWIRNEIGKGGTIEMTLLHQCEKSEILNQEKAYIEKYKSGLLNTVSNPLHTVSHLKKQISTLREGNIELNNQIKDLMGGENHYKKLSKENRQLKDQITYLTTKIEKLERCILDSGFELPQMGKKRPKKLKIKQE